MKTTKRFTAKLMAAVLAILMLCSLTTVGFTASAAEIEVAEVGATMTGGDVVYFVASSNWAEADARFAVYFFNSNDNAWESMTKVDGEDSLYEVTLPDGDWTNLIFCRMNPDTTDNNWENAWNQTADLAFEDGCNCFTINEGEWTGANGTWSVYTPSVEEPDTSYTVYFVDYPDNFDTVYAYAFNIAEEAPVAYPGTEMTLTGESSADGGLVYTTTFDKEYEGIVFVGYFEGEEIYSFETEFNAGKYFWYGNDSWFDTFQDINDNITGSGGDSTDDEIPDDEPTYTKIYFQNNWMWSDVSIHYWGSPTHDDTVWPGEPMDYEANDGKYDYYSYFIPDDIEGFTINGIKDNGSGSLDQTPDITEGWYYNICYYMTWEDKNAVGSFEYEEICNHEFNSNGVCLKCHDLDEGVMAGIAGYSLSLGGNIGVNQFVAISDEVLADPEAKMIINVPDTGSSYDVEVPVEEFSPVDGIYEFTSKVAAKEMACGITLTLVTGGQEYQLGTYTIKQYCESVLSGSFATDQLKEIARTMLNYGAASQVHFGYNIDNLANDSEYMTEEDKAISTADLSAYAPVFEGEAGEVKFYGATLSLKSETALKFYFWVENPVEDMAITVNGIYGATLEKVGNYYMFAVKDIPAHMLGETYVLETGGETITYSALSYAYLAQQSSDATLVNVANALCAYADAVSVFN